jgi:nucleotide-binding universal stress UspA family protein
MTTVQANNRIAVKSILFLTDFSEPSAVALPFATMIAHAYGSEVHALHVLLPAPLTNMTPEMAASILDQQEETAKNEMQRLDAELMGIEHETHIERGVDIWPVLSEVLKNWNIDLIVLGTHGRTGLQKFLLGSTAEEIFRRSSVPVLTIGPGVECSAHSGGRFRCVLFATDFNALSETASAYAISLAQENQARLVLLHVLPAPARSKPARPEELSVAEAIHRLRSLVPEEAELWCRPEALVQHGEVCEQILSGAEQCGADLIVLGVRGMGALAGVTTHMQRATAYNVVIRAQCPVLTLRS